MWRWVSMLLLPWALGLGLCPWSLFNPDHPLTATAANAIVTASNGWNAVVILSLFMVRPVTDTVYSMLLLCTSGLMMMVWLLGLAADFNRVWQQLFLVVAMLTLVGASMYFLLRSPEKKSIV